MPLSDNSKFGVQALTTAVNKIDPGASQIRELGIFEPEYLTTTYADIEFQDGKVHLVASKERGTAGQAVESPKRTVRTVKIPHLPIHDVIRADDVQTCVLSARHKPQPSWTRSTKSWPAANPTLNTPVST